MPGDVAYAAMMQRALAMSYVAFPSRHSTLAMAPALKQLIIGLLPQVFDVLFDQGWQGTVSDIDPIINRAPEAITLCCKQSTLLILQDELQHGRILYRAGEVFSDLCFSDKGIQASEELCKFLHALIGCIAHD